MVAHGKELAAGSFVLSGELYAETLPGFAHPAPLSLLEHGVSGKTVVYSTTNGTVAMTQCAGAARVYCGALLNAGAIVERFAERLGAAADLSDAAKAARMVYRAARAPEALLDCRVGRIMAAKGLAREVEFACRVDALPVVATLDQGRVGVSV